MDLELLAGLADLLPVEAGQGLAEDLGEAEAKLTTDATKKWDHKNLPHFFSKTSRTNAIST